MNERDLKNLEKAREYAFLLLKFRLRSERELAERLKKKKFNEQAVGQTLSFLKKKGFLDDREFARLWITSRIKKPFGLRRLREELRRKGIDKRIIDSQIETIRESYSEEETVQALARARYAKLQGLPPQQAKRRLFGYLLRRGFSPDNVTDAVNQL